MSAKITIQMHSNPKKQLHVQYAQFLQMFQPKKLWQSPLISTLQFCRQIPFNFTINFYKLKTLIVPFCKDHVLYMY